MTAMLDSYVSFVKTESPETIENININELIKECLKNFNKSKYKIKLQENIIQTSGDQFNLKELFKT